MNVSNLFPISEKEYTSLAVVADAINRVDENRTAFILTSPLPSSNSGSSTTQRPLWDQVTVTYGQVRRAAAQLSKAIIDAGIPKRYPVLVACSTHGIDQALGVIAVLYGDCAHTAATNTNNHILTLLPPNMSERDYRDTFEDFTTACLLVGASATLASPAVAAAHEQGIRVLKLSYDVLAEPPLKVEDLLPNNEALRGKPPLPDLSDLPSDFVVWQMPSSGTTGKPKCIPQTADATVIGLLDEIAETQTQDCEDISLLLQPLTHIYTTNSVVIKHLMLGSTVVLPQSYSPSLFWPLVHECGVTVISCVPLFMRQLLERRAQDEALGVTKGHKLRYVTFGGSPTEKDVMVALNDYLGVPTSNLYGLTENVGLCCMEPVVPPTAVRKPGSLGRFFGKGIEYAVLRHAGEPGGDEEDVRARIGEVGELCLRGRRVLHGYRRRPQANIESFTPVNRYFRTGDLVKEDEDGFLYFLGRTKETINVGGEKVAPAPVEEVLMRYPGVNEAMCFALEDPIMGERVAAAVILEAKIWEQWSALGDKEASNNARLELSKGILRSPEKELAPISRPRAIFIITRHHLSLIPRTAALGKVQRSKLGKWVVGNDIKPDLDIDDPGSRAVLRRAVVAPRNTLEADVLNLWRQSLSDTAIDGVCDEISMSDSFFELGGTSIQATLLAATVSSTLGVQLNGAQVMEAASVEDMVRMIRKLKSITSTFRMGSKRRQSSTAIHIGAVASAHLHPLAASMQESRVQNTLSINQEQMYMLREVQQHGSGMAAEYNEPMLMPLCGSLVNKTALQAALNAIGRRHTALRTIFKRDLNTGNLYGEIMAGNEFQWPLEHVEMPAGASLDVDALDEHVMNDIMAAADTVFDLSQKPPLFAILFTRVPASASMLGTGQGKGDESSAEKSLLLLVMHHILVDEQRDYVSPLCDEYQTSLQWWASTLTGIPPLSLPLDFHRPPLRSAAGDVVITRVPQGVHNSLKSMSKELGVTTNMLLLAAYELLLCAHSGQRKFLVGTPHWGRSGWSQEYSNVIGYFINLMPLVADVEEEGGEGGSPLTLHALCQRVKRSMTESIAHSKVPFPSIVSRIRSIDPVGGNDPSLPPLCQVTFQLQSFGLVTDDPIVVDEQTTLEQTMVRVPASHRSKQDLYVEFIEDRQGLEARFEYNTTLFRRSTIQQMANRMLFLLQSIANTSASMAKSESVFNLTMVSPVEQDRLLQGYGNVNGVKAALERTEGEKPMLVPLAFAEMVNKYPHKTAIEVYDGGRVGAKATYAELNARAESIAAALRTASVGVEDRVALMMERGTIDLIAAEIGVMKSGGAFSPIEASNPTPRIQSIVADVAPKVILCCKSTREKAGEVQSSCSSRIIVIDDLDNGTENGNSDIMEPSVGLSRNNLAYVVFTSGSTGRPKGCAIEHGSFAASISCASAFITLQSDRWLQFYAPTFDASLMEIFGCLCNGSTLLLWKPPDFVTPLQTASPTVFSATPSALASIDPSTIFEAKGGGGGSKRKLKCLFSGGEPLSREVLEKWLPFCDFLANGYGPTETTIFSSYKMFDRSRPIGAVTVGKPIPPVSYYILDGDRRLVPAGAVGTLWIGGVLVGREYLNRPELTAKVFVRDPFLPSGCTGRMYNSGDLARWSEEGEVICLGRADDQVKVRGFRIELGEISSALMKGVAAGVTAAAARVLANPCANNDPQIVGYVAPKEVNVEMLRMEMRRMLPGYMVPDAIVALEVLPKAATGKVDVKSLPPPPEWVRGVNASSIDTSATGTTISTYMAPRNDLESALVSIWMDVLGLEDENSVSLTSNFFSLGGNSLKAGVALARIRQTLSIPDIPATALFDQPTVAGLASLIETHASLDAHHSSLLSAWLVGRPSGSVKNLLRQASTFVHRRLLAHLSAEDVDLGKRIGNPPGPAPWPFPYPLYLLLQYIFIILADSIPILVWVLKIFLTAFLYDHQHWGGWVALAWLPLTIAGTFSESLLLLIYHRIMMPFGGVPGVYPLYGWMHCRWAAARATRTTVLPRAFPFFGRTPILVWILKLLGLKTPGGGGHLLIDTPYVQDPGLVSLGHGAKLHSEAEINPSMIVPAGVFGGNHACLVISTVAVGEGCQVCHRAVLPAGGRLRPYTYVKPRASPAHKGAVAENIRVKADEFIPEEHMHWSLAVLNGLVALLMNGVSSLAGVTLALVLTSVTMGDNALTVLEVRIVHTSSVAGSNAGWTMVFLSYMLFIGMTTAALVQVGMMVTYKALGVGALAPGTDLRSSQFKLWRYALFVRLLQDPYTRYFTQIFGSTKIQTAVLRLLGARIGHDVFLGDLLIHVPDAVTLDSYTSFGARSVIKCITADGIVKPIHIMLGATVGNSAVLYPGSCMHMLSVLGNDTVLQSDAVLKESKRLQGRVEYEMVPDELLASLMAVHAAEQNATVSTTTGTTTTGDKDKMAAVKPSVIEPPLYTVRAVIALWLLLPVTRLLRWGVLLLATLTVASASQAAIAPLYIFGHFFTFILASLWLRLLPTMIGYHRRWAEGEANVFSVSAQLAHGLLSPDVMAVWEGTPFLTWIARLVGFSIGTDTMLSSRLQLERSLVRYGRGAVVDSGCQVEGHYLETLKFKYHPTSMGEQAWVQSGSRVMPLVQMGARSRLLPASTVLPGEVVEPGWVWGGGMPAGPWYLHEREEMI